MVRKTAFNILNRVIINGESLKTQDFDLGMSTINKAFLKSLVYTVFRHINQLDFIIDKLVKKRPSKELRNVLYLGICQILYLDIPTHAAIYETVEMIKKTKYKNYSSFINGVLRNYSRSEISIKNIRNFPDCFTNLLKNDYSEKDLSFLSTCLEKESSVDITVKNNPDFWAKELNASVNSGNNIRLNENALIPSLKGYSDGEWWVQSYAAYLPVTLFSDLKGKNVADFCAAPGGKTSQMLSIGAKVTSFDISAKRLNILSENLKRLHFKARIINEAPYEHKFKEPFDAVLVDAPCSGTGTLRKNPDVILKKIDLDDLQKKQENLLETAMKNIKKSGEIVYSTCSLLSCEGERLIRNALSEFKDFSLIKEKQLLPDDTFGEGFYMALIKREE